MPTSIDAGLPVNALELLSEEARAGAHGDVLDVIGIRVATVIKIDFICQISICVDLVFSQAFLFVRIEVPRGVRTLAKLAGFEVDALDLLAVLRQANLARICVFVDGLRVHLCLQIYVHEVPGIQT